MQMRIRRPGGHVHLLLLMPTTVGCTSYASLVGIPIGARHWMITENQNERFDKTITQLRTCGAKYYACQEEKAPETGHLHLQCYVGFTNARAFKALQKLFPGCHLEPAKDPRAGYAYCLKEDSWTGRVRLRSHEEPPSTEESRAGLKQEVWKRFIDFAKDHTWDECIDAFPSLYAREEPGMRKHYERLRINGKEVGQKSVMIFWGPPGTGKSTAVKSQCDADYYQLMEGKWMDGYNYESILFIDDLQPNQMSRSQLIRLMEPGPARMEIKGGTVKVIATRIFITSNWSPDDWWPEKDKEAQYDRAVAMWRRAEVFNFTAEGVTHDTHGRGNTRAPAVGIVLKNQRTLTDMLAEVKVVTSTPETDDDMEALSDHEKNDRRKKLMRTQSCHNLAALAAFSGFD